MGVEFAGSCLHWSQPILHNSPSSQSQTIASVISSLSSRRKGFSCCDRTLVYHSAFIRSTELLKTRSLEIPRSKGRRKEQALRRAFSASLESFTDDDEDDEEFVRRLRELALKHHHEDDETMIAEPRNQEAESSSRSPDASSSFCFYSDPSPMPPLPPSRKHEPSAERPWFGISPEPPHWPERDEIVPASVERRANSVELPLSLRILKRKKRWQEGFVEAGESACCSIRKAFSSMVFIIRELQSYTMQMREILLYEDLQGILARVHQEMQASFVWLFQQIFSCTPTLMIYVMLLLANFTVYSMGNNTAIAAASPPSPPQSCTVTVLENYHQKQQQKQQQPRFDPSAVKTFAVGRTTSVGGNGGGGKVRPVAGATDDGRSDGSSSYHNSTIFTEEISTVPATSTEDGGGTVVTEEEESRVWNSIVEEASRMQASSRDESLMDHETLQRFVSPVTVESEPDDYSNYFRTELTYQQALTQEPDNPLLLSNFAQFLYLVDHDHDRAEYYFKRAVRIQPVDAESLSRYASFLWLARNDIGAAEETYLEAIAADPGNTFHAANYAHFLWNTGGEDTCYPLDGDDA